MIIWPVIIGFQLTIDMFLALVGTCSREITTEMVSECITLYLIHSSDGDLNDCIEGFIECRSVRFLKIQNEFPMPSQ